MIRYQLVCDRDHSFEGWFADSRAYDDQARRGLVSCAQCGSAKVSKAPMAPAIGKGASSAPALPSEALARRYFRGLRKHIEDNFENVGTQFPEEARKIHYGEAPERGIYGDATPDEVAALRDEGVEVAPVPWVPREDA